jgi:hypothetical protein
MKTIKQNYGRCSVFYTFKMYDSTENERIILANNCAKTVLNKLKLNGINAPKNDIAEFLIKTQKELNLDVVNFNLKFNSAYNKHTNA